MVSLKMNLGKYARYAVVTLCGLLLFFLGSSLPFQAEPIALISLFAIVLLTVALSYGNRTPLGGLFFGLFTSVAFLLGFFLMSCVWELSNYHPYIVGPVGIDQGLTVLLKVLSSYGPGMLAAVSAFASVGLFFGVLGYISGHISPQASSTQPHAFRDYWSSVSLLGKSDRREYSTFDRKLSSWSFRRREWWKRLLEKITEPELDLVFVPRAERDPLSAKNGDLFDLSSGRMIGNNVVDPADLASRYRPSILKVAETSANPKGLRRLAVEELLARFLRWFIPSRTVWVFYLLLSGILVSSVYYLWPLNHAVYTFSGGAEYLAAGSAAVVSIITLFFVWRWRKAAKELFYSRPDERVLIFIVYAILALLYGFYFEVIMNPPTVPENWLLSWLVWTRWLLALTLLAGFGYTCIHREAEVVNTYFYDNRSSKSEASRISPFKQSHDEPFWLQQEQVRGYWVLRYMYYWRYEVTTVPHQDWERVEVWVDAENGIARWIVSDYHYRELWYKVQEDLPSLYVRFFVNFHTPVPIVDSAQIKSISQTLSLKTRKLLKIAATGKTFGTVEDFRKSLQDFSKILADLHPPDWISSYGLPRVGLGFCSNLPWTYWRYPYGLEKDERYLTEAAARFEDQPSNAHKNCPALPTSGTNGIRLKNRISKDDENAN
jgi:hypothetical protein